MTVKVPVLVLICFTVIASSHVTSAFYWHRSSLVNDSERMCLPYMNKCTPWANRCCDGLSCTNLRKGYCVFPLEMCVCQLKDSYNIDSDPYMY